MTVLISKLMTMTMTLAMTKYFIQPLKYTLYYIVQLLNAFAY